MIKLGQKKVPIDKIPLLAKACGVDQAFFMRLALQEYAPNSWEAVAGALGDILTPKERTALDIIREVFPEDDLDMGTTGRITFKDCIEAMKAP